jgi:two-component system cell cycle sensor histidine kinase/response regulator CckA
VTDAGENRFFELASDVLAVLLEDGSIERANSVWKTSLGYQPRDVEGRRLSEFLVAADAEAMPALLERARTARAEGELRVFGADGTVHRLIWRISFDAATARYRAAGHLPSPTLDPRDELRLSEQRYRELFESHPAPMAVWDPGTGEILAANDAALAQYGYERDELAGLSVAQLVHPDDLQQLVDAVPNFGWGLARSVIFRHRRRDGSELEVEVTGHRLAWDGRPARLVMAIDVSERRRLEEQLRQAQKMEAVGRLAGGIAHDFNNLLTAISGFTRLLLDSLPENTPAHEDAQQIQRAADGAASLTGQLLSFSRRVTTRAATIDVNESVREAHRLLERVLGGGIQLRLALASRKALVSVDPAELEQVVINLCLNARDAMPDGGMVTIETKIGAPPPWARGLSAPTVVLSVVDTGSGMSGEQRERAFEPFFTTKGHGTGLGLASVYVTVNRAGGQIRLESELGAGTTIRICLPAAAGEPAATPPTRAAKGARPAQARILLVDDDPQVRSLIDRVLRDAGYEVIVAADGQAALARAAESAPIDLLLSDVVLPRMNGVALARKLQARFPDMPVLLISGYSDEPFGGIGSAPYELLLKPFTDDQLLGRVSSVLET